MKYLKYILGGLAILIVGFSLLGLIRSELAYVCETTANKSKAESWAVIQDQDKMSEWLAGFQKIEHVSGTAGSIGAVSNIYFEIDGQEMTIQETITDIVPDESISMSYTSDFMNMDYKLIMTSIDGKTKISTSTTAIGNGVVSKSIMALMGNSFKEQEETNLSNLKKTINQNTKNYFLVEEDILTNKVD